MKKYISPSIEIVPVQFQHSLLAVSSMSAKEGKEQINAW